MSRRPDNGPASQTDPFRPNDPGDMLARIREFPRQVEDAWGIVSGLDIERELARDVRQVLVAGMGGSAIGADLVSGLVADQCPLPIHVHRSYGVPAWVDRHTLFIASSYSGNTEETLDAWDAAVDAGAKCIAITTGGELARRAQAAGATAIGFDYGAQPRAALGYSFTLVYGLLARLGWLEDAETALRTGLEFLESAAGQWEPDACLEVNFAKRIAKNYSGRIPVMIAAGHLAPVARRWSTQLNENTKSWAFWQELPELNHNLIVGLRHPRKANSIAAGESTPREVADTVHITLLRSPHYRDRIVRRLEITEEVLSSSGFDCSDVTAPTGADRLAELFWMVWLGDYVSYYLACLYGEDPTPVETIELLKRRLRES